MSIMIIKPTVPGADMKAIEWWAIEETLAITNGSTSKASKILGISPRTIQNRMSLHGKKAADYQVKTVVELEPLPIE